MEKFSHKRLLPYSELKLFLTKCGHAVIASPNRPDFAGFYAMIFKRTKIAQGRDVQQRDLGATKRTFSRGLRWVSWRPRLRAGNAVVMRFIEKEAYLFSELDNHNVILEAA